MTNKVEPKSTETARSARVAGIVIAEAIIDKDERAVRQWHFKPGTMNGQPVDVIFNLTVNFELGS